MPSLFCKIIEGTIPADIVYKDDHVVAFKDTNPQAPVHILIVTRQPIEGLANVPEEGDHKYILNAAKKIAKEHGLTNGYRLVINQGPDAGQTINHLHAHLLGGRPMSWPPG